jgi:hypothetical protein
MKDLKVLYVIGSIALLISIFIFLPMFFTYLSSGDPRAPSELHQRDPVGPKTTKDHGTKKWGNSKDINKGYKTEP